MDREQVEALKQELGGMPSHKPVAPQSEAFRALIEREHAQTSEEAKHLRQRLHEVELIRTGCQAALCAMEESAADNEAKSTWPNTKP